MGMMGEQLHPTSSIWETLSALFTMSTILYESHDFTLSG
jgi:hypothetical protein